MQDFKTMISQALDSGMSPEDIAKRFTDAFNEANAKKEAPVSARDKLIKVIEDNFWFRVKKEKEKVSTLDAVALAWLTIVRDTEYGKSIEDTETLKDLFNHISDVVDHAADSFRLKKGLRDAVGDLVEVFDFGQVFKVDNKSKDEKAGPDRKCQCKRSDKDIIDEFLEALK